MVYDLIGKVAIIPEARATKALARKLLQQKAIKAVYARGKIKGKLRLPELKWLAGQRIREVLHRESGCLIKLDIKSCYFSPRLATDRLEIAKKVKPNEKVLVMFAGVAPYALIIAKHSKASSIYCIELSKVACKYAKANVELNKFRNIEILQGDVVKVAGQLAKKGFKFDRILMPRPQLKKTFLEAAFKLAKPGTWIHYYDFKPIEEWPGATIKAIKQAAAKAGEKIKIVGSKKVREIAPYKIHGRVDFKLQ